MRHTESGRFTSAVISETMNSSLSALLSWLQISSTNSQRGVLPHDPASSDDRTVSTAPVRGVITRYCCTSAAPASSGVFRAIAWILFASRAAWSLLTPPPRTARRRA